jgi:superfamily II DNA/RNA helicase
MSFEKLQLAPSILKAITECGYTAPTPIQEQAVPIALAGRDLIASAQTGTGKTAAFILPALQLLSSRPAGKNRGPRILVLTPTRELATQVSDAARQYGKYQRLKTATILGGMPYREQLRLLSQPLDLVVATPGRLNDHLERGRINLSQIELLVLDEADRMLDMGFIEDVERIAAATPPSRQTLLFSATLDARIERLAQGILNQPEMVLIAAQKSGHENIEQRLLVADDLSHKTTMLNHLIGEEELTRAIVFSATKRDADDIAFKLRSAGHSAAALHGDMKQNARNRTISDMRRGKIRLLVATDVAARGLDVSGISHVINFDLPKFAEDYVHRIGRTGRAGASGVAISFVSHKEVDCLKRIERYLGQSIPQHVIPGLEAVRPLESAAARRNNKGPAGAGKNARRFSSSPAKGRNSENSRNGGGSSPARKGPARNQKPVVVEYRRSSSGRTAERAN